jgi:hypothetical protein
MEIQQSVFGEIAQHEGARVDSVDVGALIRRLILFDRVIVKSVRLRELPALVKAFGKTGLQDLLASGLLKFSCEFTSIITDIHRNGMRVLPFEHFSFGIVDASKRDEDLHKEMGALRQVSGLRNQDRDAIEEAVWHSVIRPAASFGQDLLHQFDSHIRLNNPALKWGLLTPVRNAVDRPNLALDDLQVSVEETEHRTFRIVTNLGKDFNLPPEKSHSLLQSAVTATSNLTLRLSEMQAYASLTGFREDEAPLLFGWIAPIIAPQNPATIENQFERVIKVAQIPDFTPGQKVDVKKLLQLRDSPECRDFRSWLLSAEKMTDGEIREFAENMRSIFGWLVQTPLGKSMRYATTTLLGLVPGLNLAAGPVAGGLDTFVVDKLLPKSGVIAFLHDQYPSLYKD